MGIDKIAEAVAGELIAVCADIKIVSEPVVRMLDTYVASHLVIHVLAGTEFAGDKFCFNALHFFGKLQLILADAVPLAHNIHHIGVNMMGVLVLRQIAHGRKARVYGAFCCVERTWQVAGHGEVTAFEDFARECTGKVFQEIIEQVTNIAVIIHLLVAIFAQDAFINLQIQEALFLGILHVMQIFLGALLGVEVQPVLNIHLTEIFAGLIQILQAVVGFTIAVLVLDDVFIGRHAAPVFERVADRGITIALNPLPRTLYRTGSAVELFHGVDVHGGIGKSLAKVILELLEVFLASR